MGKHWARQQVRRNEVADVLEKGIEWTSVNRRAAGSAAVAIVAILLVGGLFLYSSRTRQNAAWDRLAVSESAAYAGNPDAALKQLQELAAEFPGAKASSYGQLFAGDVQFQRAKYTETIEAYNKVLERGEPKAVLPLALGGLGVALEAAGQHRQAVEKHESFLQTYPDHFLAPQVHASLARCQAALGQNDQARATLQKISLQYPDTSWAAWAQARLSPTPAATSAKK